MCMNFVSGKRMAAERAEGRRETGSSSIRVVAALVVSLVLLNGCSGAAPNPLTGANLIVVLSDALRADHLGAYGYPRRTSPFLDRLASEGMLFERAVSPSSFTRESVAALFTGRLPSASGAMGWMAAPAKGTPTLAELLHEAGYVSGFFVTTTVLDQAFARGFDETAFLAKSWSTSRLTGRLCDRALEFARAHKDHKFLLYLHAIDPHAPYDPPPDLLKRFAKRRYEHPISLYSELRPRLAEYITKGFGQQSPGFQDLVNRYDAEISDVDQSVQRLFDGLGELKLLDRTVIVFLSDHGEEFLDHGWVEHAWTLYQESIHVPLIFWAGDRLPAVRIANRVSTVDVLPTVLEILGVRNKIGNLDGEKLVEWTGRRFNLRQHSRPIIAELLLGHRMVTRTVIEDGWKYIASQRWFPPEGRSRIGDDWEAVRIGLAFDVWGPLMKEELYNLRRDPGERDNLIGTEDEMGNYLRSLLDHYKVRSRGVTEGAADSATSASSLSKKRLKQLKALGYLGPTKGSGGAAQRRPGKVLVPPYEFGQTIEFQRKEVRPFLPYGWSLEERGYRWSDGGEALVWFWLQNPPGGRLTLELRARALDGERVQVRLNERPLGELEFPGTHFVERDLEIPAGRLRRGVNRLLFLFPDAHSPAASGGSDYRNLGIALNSLTIRRRPSDGP